jgi:hypothetical protein
MPPSMNMPDDLGPDEYVQGIIWHGNPGITKTVDQIMQEEKLYQAKLATEGKQSKNEKGERGNEKNEFRLKKSQKNSPAPLKLNPNGGWVNPEERKPEQDIVPTKDNTRLNPQTVPLTFAGPPYNASGTSVPPDTNGDVGPSDVLITTNDTIRSYSRTGVLGSLNVSGATFWASVLPGAANSPCDHHVRYDRLSQRWFVVAIGCGSATPNKIGVAVSSGSTITGAASFTFFQFQHDLVGTTPNTDTGGFADYPTLGVDKNALYVGDNVFNAAGTAFLGCSAFVINKANLIAGSLTVTAFRNIGPPTTTGIYTPQGVDNEDPSASVGFFIGSDTAYNRLNVRKVTTPGGVPAISGSTQITVSTGAGINVPATNGTLDSLDDRPFAAMINVNRVLTSARQDVASLWTSQSFGVTKASPFNPATTGTARMGSRWYEINTDPATPALRQSGTFSDSVNSEHYWIPSVAMSGQGFMAIGTSIGGTGIFPGTVVAGRLREDSPSGADALGVTEAKTTAFAGQAAYTTWQSGTAGRRWGDYSQTIVDPNDDMTVWAFAEYSNSTGGWQSRAIKLQAPPPCKPTSCATTVTLDTSGAYQGVATITGTSTAGSECYDGNVIDWSGFRNYSSYADNVGTAVSYTHGGGPGFHGPGGINAVGNGHLMSTSGAATTGAGTATVQAFAPNAPGNSTIYLSPTSFKIKLSITGATGGSKFPLTVTNPDGQQITTSDAICTLAPTAAGGFIQGKVVNSSGRGVSGAKVVLVNTSLNSTYQTITNNFGYFTINDLNTGDFYVLRVEDRRLTFNPVSFTLNESLSDLLITANP